MKSQLLSVPSPIMNKEICFFHCWLLLIFPIYLRFLAFLLLMCFCLYFQYLEYSELLSELLKFIFLSKFGKYSDIVSSNIFSAPFFYPFMTLITHKLECLILSYMSPRFWVFSFILYFLCLISNDLSINSVTFFSDVDSLRKSVQ